MLEALVFALSALVFLFSFSLLKIVADSQSVIRIFLNSIELLSNYLLSDLEKQNGIRRLAFEAFAIFVKITLKLFALIALVSAPVVLFYSLSLISLDAFLSFSTRWDVLLVSTFLAVFIVLAIRKVNPDKNLQKQSNADDELAYSDIDRALHNLAFGAPGLRRFIYRLETFFFKQRWQKIKPLSPVFITSLARSGTTVLLNALHELPTLRSHTYQDMPFVFTPVIWSVFSTRFSRSDAKRPRAHGDGIWVNQESPEALEEALWLHFFPQKYSREGIFLWREKDESFLEFFSDYMKRLLVSGPGAGTAKRYLSKNNNNIARIPVLQQMFPDARILVPLRNPIDHAHSLWKQHKNFVSQQNSDAFVAKYMADIGHFEFGNLHKPILFPEKQAFENLTPENKDYWLVYWINCYKHLSSFENLTWLSYEHLCIESEDTLRKLCEELSLDVSSSELDLMTSVISSKVSHVDNEGFSSSLVAEAESLYQTILKQCI